MSDLARTEPRLERDDEGQGTVPGSDWSVREERLSRTRERFGRVLVAWLRMPATAAIGLVVLGMLGAWSCVYWAGGGPSVYFHLFYLPVVFAASRFQWRGGVAAGLVAGIVAGPLSPIGASRRLEFLPGDWIVRMVAFVVLGMLVAWLSAESSRTIRFFVSESRGARELRRALDRGEFVPHYQPLVDLVTGRTVGFETLCRWEHPANGTISPADFIPLAERTGAIIGLGTFILRAATTQAAAWIASGSGDLVMAVNVSAHQLCQPDFGTLVVAALRDSGLDPGHLCLEITETAILRNRSTALANLDDLHRLGVLIALDDFGTGHSSLAYLQEFPVDIIKIDQSFVSRIDQDAEGASFVAAIIAMARALGASTVGEGIERVTQLEALRAMGCDQGQGYHLGRPARADHTSWAAAAAGPQPESAVERPAPGTAAGSAPAHSAIDAETARLIAATRAASAAGEHQLAITLATQAVEAGAASADLGGQVEALHELAEQQIHAGRFEEVITTCERSLEVVGRLGAAGSQAATCRALTTRSYALGELGLGEEALEGLNSAHEIADRLQDKTLQYWVLNRLGVVNNALGRNDDARAQLTGALTLSEELSEEMRFAALNNLTDWRMSFIQELRANDEMDRANALLPEALRQAESAVALARALDHPYRISIALSNYGVMRWLAGDGAGALVLLAESQRVAAGPGYRSIELLAVQYSAPILLAQGDAKGAIEVLEHVLQQWRGTDERFVERDCLLLLSNAEAVAGNFRAALRYHQNFYQLEQTIRSERIEIRAHLLANRMELENARSETADAQARNRQLEKDTRSLQGRTIELEHRVNQDSLTHLANRRYLDTVLPQLFRTSPPSGRGLYVAMLDLDHFKAVNDTFGHAIGDQVLQRVAELMLQHSRTGDLVARYGGEEFLLGFTNIERTAAAAMCERLRKAIAAEDWDTIRSGLHVTASIGLAARADVMTLDQLIERADEYLYLAKGNGRNRVHPSTDQPVYVRA